MPRNHPRLQPLRAAIAKNNEFFGKLFSPRGAFCESFRNPFGRAFFLFRGMLGGRRIEEHTVLQQAALPANSVKSRAI